MHRPGRGAAWPDAGSCRALDRACSWRTGPALWLSARQHVNPPATPGGTGESSSSLSAARAAPHLLCRDATARGGCRPIRPRGTHCRASAAKRHAAARRFLILAVTYGDGTAPQSARAFPTRLGRECGPAGVPMAVLGFGDRSSPGSCVMAKTWPGNRLGARMDGALPFSTRVDRQSPQRFARGAGEPASPWIQLGASITNPSRYRKRFAASWRRPDQPGHAGHRDALRPAAAKPLAAADRGGPSLRRRTAGAPPQAGDGQPRFYSLASAAADGFVEIVVRKICGYVRAS